MSKRHALLGRVLLTGIIAAVAQGAPPAACAGDWASGYHGDLGLGLNANRLAEAARDQHNSTVPFLNGDYGSAFARVDTFGVGLWPMAAGQLELVTRVVGDGYQPATPGLPRRRDSVPLGLGTLQTSDWGGLMANLYQDLGPSHGKLGTLLYGAELALAPVTLYPQFGLEYRNAAYLRYYDGTSAYRPGAATSPFIALFGEIHLVQHWYININLRKSWPGSAIRNSPLVDSRSPVSALAAISYRFD